MEFGQDNIVGYRIIVTRKLQSMLQKELLSRINAAGCEMSATALSRIERQHRRVVTDELIAIAIALGIDANELFNYDIIRQNGVGSVLNEKLLSRFKFSVATITKIEQGRRHMYDYEIIWLSELLDCDPNYLLLFSDEEKSKS